jgi:malate dehydrogenase (oxaloacetate-decarboxylating)(NADP+)
VEGNIPLKVREAVSILHRNHPDLIVDGDMQANFAINNEMLTEHFPFSKLAGAPANTLIFPYLTAGNIAYKLIQELAGAEAIGPILMGLDKSIHVLQMGSSVNEIVDMTAIAVIDAQNHESNKQK